MKTKEQELTIKFKKLLESNPPTQIFAEKCVTITKEYHAQQLAIDSVSNSLKVGRQTFDLCDCPYQINTWLEKYNIQADNIISINQANKQVVMFYKAFNDC